MTKKAALGKGLGALISDIKDVNSTKDRVLEYETGTSLASITEIPVDNIEPNPYQPRTTFDDEALQELSDSIKLLGVIQPITVRSIGNGRYQIISGERRFRASKLAGLTHVPAYIRGADDQGMLEMAIVENIQRQDLNPIEVALSFQRLILECELTQEEMADRVGKGRATVTNYLRLLKLPAEIQLIVREGRVSLGHAKALLAVENPFIQLDLCNEVIEKDLSVRQLEAKAKQLKKFENAEKEYTGKDEDEMPSYYFSLLEYMGEHFNNKVSVSRNSNGKGRITIQFDNDDQVEEFCRVLKKVKS